MLGSNDREHTDKLNRKDFVTIADIKSQNILRENLAKHFPDDVILSEEDPEEQREALFTPDFTGFVLDPIDGTFNFKRNMKESAISIGFIENGHPIAGVIFDPYRDELFTVEVGKGAYCNGQPINVSAQTTIEGASIATSNSYDDSAMRRNLLRHLTIHEQTDHMPWTSCPGSGVLIMAWVAMGRIDAYHHNGLKPWDNAAAFLLVREASGLVETLDGNPEAPFTSPTVLMGNQAIVQSLRSNVFASIDQDLLT